MTFDQKQQNEKSTQYNRIGLDEPKKKKKSKLGFLSLSLLSKLKLFDWFTFVNW